MELLNNSLACMKCPVAEAVDMHIRNLLLEDGEYVLLI